MVHPVSRRIAAVERDLERRGFTLESGEAATTAVDGPADLTGVDAPLHVVHLVDGSPLTIVSAIANAAHEGRTPVLVTDRWTHEETRDVLSPPFLLAGRSDGARAFHTIEDRIRLSDDSFACVGSHGQMEWSETATDSDEPELCLDVGGETVAVFDSVDGLCCPGPEPTAFEYRYNRGDDGKLRVFRQEQTVGRYTSFRSMRADGFCPVSLPLVPEHHVRWNGDLARAILLASFDKDRIEYSTCRSD